MREAAVGEAGQRFRPGQLPFRPLGRALLDLRPATAGVALGADAIQHGQRQAISSVLKRMQTRFVFALEKDQICAIQGVAADLDERLLSQLPKLPRGVCAVSGSSEIVRHGFLMRVRQRETPVGGSTPKVFAGRKKAHLKVTEEK